MTLRPGDWHALRGEARAVPAGEVSTVSGHLVDNVFADATGRFASIEEDEASMHLPLSDHDGWRAGHE